MGIIGFSDNFIRLVLVFLQIVAGANSEEIKYLSPLGNNEN